MADAAVDYSRHFTYGDYRKWPDEERWELIDGQAFSMCAAPSLRHQGMVGWLSGELRDFLKGKTCRLYISPVDVLLPKPGQGDDETDTVVEPDIVVVCDPKKLTSAFIRGAPDLVVEILSPRTSKRDMKEKFELYERSGVREYWVVEPKAAWLHRYVLRIVESSSEGRYGEALIREKGDGLGHAASLVLDGFSFDTEALFAAE